MMARMNPRHSRKPILPVVGIFLLGLVVVPGTASAYEDWCYKWDYYNADGTGTVSCDLPCPTGATLRVEAWGVIDGPSGYGSVVGQYSCGGIVAQCWDNSPWEYNSAWLVECVDEAGPTQGLGTPLDGLKPGVCQASAQGVSNPQGKGLGVRCYVTAPAKESCALWVGPKPVYCDGVVGLSWSQVEEAWEDIAGILASALCVLEATC